jgi:ATP-binding cassette, subfamily C (CFTR/MRP), member 1
MDLGVYLRIVVEAWTELETSLSAVARIRHFADRTPIEQDQSKSEDVSVSWPQNGAIEFADFVASYSEGGLPVINGINLAIREGEKIGICGRTGSGKSSLVSTLFGLLHQQSGNITIDGMKTDTVPLSKLREAIIALPQEPFFLYGTVRENLFPWHSSPTRIHISDIDMVEALKRVNLLEKLTIASNAAGYSSPLLLPLEPDALFSQGEKQLFCLARATLMTGKIVVLDEATSNVDRATDARMQEIVRDCFRNRTVLAVAHRLETILDFDRVVVMDKGQIVEIGQPAVLMTTGESRFRALVESSANGSV